MIPNHLSAAWVRPPYTFNLELDYPLVSSMLAVAKFLAERRIQVESISVGPAENNGLRMVLKCLLEKDRLQRTTDLLSAVVGVVTIEIVDPHNKPL